MPQDILLGQRNKEKHWREVCAVDGTQDHRGSAYTEAPGAKTFMFVHDKLISTIQQQKGGDNNINYKYRKSNTPT